MEAKAGGSDQYESAPLTRGQRIKRHYKKYWWAHLLALVIVTLVVTLPVYGLDLLLSFSSNCNSVYVAYPHIAQSGINKSTILVVGQKISNPSPDSLDLDFSSVIDSSSSYKPHLDAFNASFYLEGSDTPLTTIEIPAGSAQDGSRFNAEQRVPIKNLTEFTNYCQQTLASKSFYIHLRGRGGLKLGGLPTTQVNYNEKVKIVGEY